MVDERREHLWIAMSDMWLDTELPESELREIADVVRWSGFSREELEIIFKYELEPFLRANMFAMEWVRFDVGMVCYEARKRAGKVGFWRRVAAAYRGESIAQAAWDRVKDIAFGEGASKSDKPPTSAGTLNRLSALVWALASVLAAVGFRDTWRYQDGAEYAYLLCWSVIVPAIIAVGIWFVRPRRYCRLRHETLCLIICILGTWLAVGWGLQTVERYGLLTGATETSLWFLFGGGDIRVIVLAVTGALLLISSKRLLVFVFGVVLHFGLLIFRAAL